MTQLSIEELQVALPAQFKKSVNKELLDSVNNVISDPEVYQSYRDNLLSYAHVLNNGKFKVSSYVDAIRYCSFKFMNHTNIMAYSKAFPDKIKRFNEQGVSAKDISSYVHAYSKTKLVTMIMEQAFIPTWLLNQDLFQQALNVQADLMLNANSEKVRSDAANSVLTQLKRPDTQKIELDVGVKTDKTIEALRASTLELVAQQKMAIQSGAMQAQEVAHSKLITDADYEEVPSNDNESIVQQPTKGGILFK